MTDDRIARQLRFVAEVDRLKSILRQTRLIDGSRPENTAEHSWHLALAGSVLAEHAPPGTDAARALRMMLVHDVVEIDAGDTFAFDTDGYLDKAEREEQAAARIFGLLPPDQGAELRALWEEFEAGTSADARFAVAMDRIQPLLQNFHGGGGSWREHGITRAQVLRRMAPIRAGAPTLWPTVLDMIDEARALGHIAPDPPAVP
ncbi:MAG TPA: HD domain-containing protein [Longimicrobium sp.]|nr:HD domain-containing protein [Longimicrobium sp.]